MCGCTPTTCAAQDKNCGTIPDGCGGSLNCGSCTSPDICGGTTPNVCGPAPCTPTTCAAQGKNCGSMSDGCTGTLNCGTCSTPNSCGGGGTPNVCGCTPTTCAAQGKNCGTIADGCGGSLSCGTCSTPNTLRRRRFAERVRLYGGACCTSSANADGDCITDCNEDNDGDPWTDKNIFNGMRVRRANQCNFLLLLFCSINDSISKANNCMSGETLLEEKNQCAGWDWSNPPDDICNAGYGFTPAWSGCDSTWQADWQGFINLTQAGQHCFRITGSNNEGCASLFFNNSNPPAQNDGSTRCYNVAAGVYPIRWHYTMDDGSSSSMHVMYCSGGGATCTPSVVLPARMLRHDESVSELGPALMRSGPRPSSGW